MRHDTDIAPWGEPSEDWEWCPKCSAYHLAGEVPPCEPPPCPRDFGDNCLTCDRADIELADRDWAEYERYLDRQGEFAYMSDCLSDWWDRLLTAFDPHTAWRHN